MNTITPIQRPEPVEMHSGNLFGTTVMCVGGILRVLSVGKLPWGDVIIGWYQLTLDEQESWAHWACWAPGYYQCGGIEWRD